jgi:hypothetical protein
MVGPKKGDLRSESECHLDRIEWGRERLARVAAAMGEDLDSWITIGLRRASAVLADEEEAEG